MFFEHEMARAVGWRGIRQAEWRDADSPRVRWLAGQGAQVMAADDPLEAAGDWLFDPPVEEARELAPAERPPVFVELPDEPDGDVDLPPVPSDAA